MFPEPKPLVVPNKEGPSYLKGTISYSYSIGGKELVLDSGHTNHISGDKEMFHYFDPLTTPKQNIHLQR